MLKINKPNDFLFYSEVNVPWPCANRDFIVHMIINNPTADDITIDLYSEPNWVPIKEGVVRVKKHSAHWNIENLGKGELKVEYILSFDPAGSVPAWVTNLFVFKAPFETF